MTEGCQDLRMNLKSVFTQRMYKSDVLKPIVHRKCLEWINLITRKIYNDGVIKTILNRFITDEDITSFVKKSLDIFTPHAREEKVESIIARIRLSTSQNNYAILYTDTLIYDLFFIMYLKGGMATRYICLYLNTLTSSTIYSKESLLENLGDISDYDFNMTINPLLAKNYFLNLQGRISSIVDETFSEIANSDTFFTDAAVVGELARIARDIIANHPILSLSGCELQHQRNIGKATKVELEPFSLSRLMVSIKARCSSNICTGDTGLKNNTALLAELIDISYPSYDSFSERMHAWKYANNAIFISFCDLDYGICHLPLAPSKDNIIRFNSLDDILDDIQITISQSTARGDFSKVEKRKKRLKFLGTLVCNYEIAKSRVYGGDIKKEVVKKCQEAVEAAVCKNQYINKEVGFYISNLTVGLTMDDFIIYRIIRAYIFELTKRLQFEKTAIMIGGSVVYMDIVEYTIRQYDEYLRSTPNVTLLSLRDRMCRLMVECISLEMSFTDNYMKNFIAQLFIKTLLQFILGDYSGIEQFDKSVIVEKENVYNVFIRPFIRYSVNYILDSLINTCEATCGETQIRVEDDVACHYNIYKTLEGLISEKITVTMFAKQVSEDFITFFLSLVNPFVMQYLQSSQAQGVVFIPEVQIVTANEHVFRLNVQYENIFFQRDIFYMRDIAFQNTSFKITHTVLEIRLIKDNIPPADITLFKSSPSEKIKMGFTQKQKLLNEYNLSVDQCVHWYTKSIYTKRLSALNGIITDPNIRAIYNVEFPPIMRAEDPEWLKQLVLINQSHQVQPIWAGRQPTNDEVLNHVKAIQTLFLPYFPLELIRSVEWYTGSDNYTSLNKNLRRKLPLTVEQQSVVRNLDYLFSILNPVGQPVTLYRGVRARSIEGGEIKDDGYISASTNFNTALSFASLTEKCCILVISVPASAKLLSVSILSQYPQEDEMLLERGSSFVIRRVEDTTIQGGIEMRLLHVDYLHE